MIHASFLESMLNVALGEYEAEQRQIADEKRRYNLHVRHRAEMRRAFLNTLHPSEHYAHMQRWMSEDYAETMNRQAALSKAAEDRLKHREERRKAEEAARAAAEEKAREARPLSEKWAEIAELRLKDILGPIYDYVMKK